MKTDIQDKIYRIYVTDSLKYIVENTARFGGGSIVNSRYYDVINPVEDVPEESADEIIDRIKNKLAKLGGEE